MDPDKGKSVPVLLISQIDAVDFGDGRENLLPAWSTTVEPPVSYNSIALMVMPSAVAETTEM